MLMPRCHSDPTKASAESGVHCVVNAFNCYFQALLTFNIILLYSHHRKENVVEINNSNSNQLRRYTTEVAFFQGDRDRATMSNLLICCIVAAKG